MHKKVYRRTKSNRMRTPHITAKMWRALDSHQQAYLFAVLGKIAAITEREQQRIETADAIRSEQWAS